MRIKEFAPRKLVIFDIDDTLVHTQTKVHVIKDSRVIHSLNSHEFTHYKLKPGESFDFGDFANAHEFFTNAKPIIPMINQLKHDIATGNKVVMVTARADFNDRELFLDTFRKYGVDMSKVHVYRAGNMHIKAQTEEKKKIIIRGLLGKEHYTKAIMYDDAEPNLHAFISLKNEYPHTKFYAWHVSLDGEASEYHRTDESLDEDQSDYEIRNYKKLDKILVELCNEIVEGQKTDPNLYGMVAACVLDPDNNRTTSTSTKEGNQWKHAERNAMDAYNKIYGDIPEGSIIITTLSPCSEHMDDRYGESCTDLINQSTVKKVYSGYTDPTQEEEDREFNIMETENSSIRDLCKKFADTFLDDIHENVVNEYRETKSKRARRNGIDLEAFGSQGEFQINADINDKRVGQVLFKVQPYVSDDERKPMLYPLDLQVFPKYRGQGIAKIMYDWAKELGYVVQRSGEQTDAGYNFWNKHRQDAEVWENFADGKHPEDKGDSHRHGIKKGTSLSQLDKIVHSKSASPRKKQLAHWQANMRRGRAK